MQLKSYASQKTGITSLVVQKQEEMEDHLTATTKEIQQLNAADVVSKDTNVLTKGKPKTKIVEDPSYDDDDEIYLLQLSPDDTYKYTLNIHGKDIEMLIDPGSSANILDEDTYKTMKPHPTLTPCSTRIFPYNAATPLQVMGNFQETIRAGDKQSNAKFFVIKGKGGSLLVRALLLP